MKNTAYICAISRTHPLLHQSFMNKHSPVRQLQGLIMSITSSTKHKSPLRGAEGRPVAS